MTVGDRKVIVFCCNSLWGLVNFRGRIIETLARDGHRVVLVAPADVSLDQVRALHAEFVQWKVSPRSANPLRELQALLSLWHLYRRIKPDLAFHFTIKSVMYGAIVSRLVGVSCLSVITGLGYMFLEHGWKARVARLLYRLTLRQSREVWFLNGDDRDMFASAGLTSGLQVVTLPGEGIDLDYFAIAPLPPSERHFVFLMIARLVRDKGVLEFLDAAGQVREAHPRAVFRLLGPTYSANAMSVPLSTIESSVEAGHVQYLGAADDVRPAIAESHCVILPSYREGMPRVLLEAAAMGRAAIATDVTGCRDVVRAGDTGLLCQSQDAKSLAKACIDMLSLSHETVESMGQRARAEALEKFGVNVVIERYQQTIAALR